MKTLTTVVLFQLNLYTVYIFHTGVKGERKRKTAHRDRTLSIKQLSHNNTHNDLKQISFLSQAASVNQNVTAPHCGTYWYYTGDLKSLIHHSRESDYISPCMVAGEMSALASIRKILDYDDHIGH